MFVVVPVVFAQTTSAHKKPASVSMTASTGVRSVEGTIISILSNSLALSTVQGLQTFSLDKSTKAYRGAAAQEISSVLTGSKVRVRYEVKNGQNQAQSIEVA